METPPERHDGWTVGDPHRPGVGSVLTDYEPPAPDGDRVGRHLGLFVATFVSCVWCGGLLVGRSALWGPLSARWPVELALFADPTFVRDGLMYAVPFLLFLTVHEFGHYTAARLLKTRVSLPYFIPIPLPGTLGTFGAVIRIKEPLRRTRQLFDIGAAGPLAGFVIAVGVLVLAAVLQPPAEYLLGVVGHEDVVAAIQATGAFPVFDPDSVAPGTTALVFGDTVLFSLLNGLGDLRVSGDEIVHYPLLLAGWLGLFFTALNLLPVGQLDGGHVVYALFGPAAHRVVARVTTLLLLVSGTIGLALDLAWLAPWTLWAVVALVYALALARLLGPEWRLVGLGVAVGTALTALVVLAVPGLALRVEWTGWLFWVGMILFVIRVDHPPVLRSEPLTPGRKLLGWLCVAIFLLCFSFQPIQFYGG
ncbi:site-2 protease family protein [Rubrivirga sp. IMCC43871]|uniref:site-2 protease family protein n=1 Tax=Rubrivirga sp. IMCC43871 TaxID=3391575 RepID=UPI00398FFEC7